MHQCFESVSCDAGKVFLESLADRGQYKYLNLWRGSLIENDSVPMPMQLENVLIRSFSLIEPKNVLQILMYESI